eukprot:1161206-Pelagomonas_calceolata.AAC.7
MESSGIHHPNHSMCLPLSRHFREASCRLTTTIHQAQLSGTALNTHLLRYNTEDSSACACLIQISEQHF